MRKQHLPSDELGDLGLSADGEDEVFAGKRTRPRVWECPECPEKFSGPEALGPHLERHRPVYPPLFTARGLPASRPCPKGCGRHFGRGSQLQAEEHVLNCDGSLPLAPRATRPRRFVKLPGGVVAPKPSRDWRGKAVGWIPVNELRRRFAGKQDKA